MAIRIGKNDTSAAVNVFMSVLEHPHKATIEALRELILSTDPTIAEGIKWKLPSFRTSEYFATLHLRAKEGMGLVLHLGAKVRDVPSFAIDDPQSILTWLARDRAIVNFSSVDDLRNRAEPLRALLRQWIRFV